MPEDPDWPRSTERSETQLARCSASQGSKLWSEVKRVRALAGLYFDELSDNLELLSHNEPRKRLPLRF